MRSPVAPMQAPPRSTRVLFVLNSLRGGGAEKQVISLLEHLDADLFTLGLVYLRRMEQLLPQLPRHRLALLECPDANHYLSPAALRRLARTIDAFAADVVVCTNMWSLLNVSLARPLTRRKFRVVEVFHTTVLQTGKQRLQLTLHRPLFARADLLVYVCNSQRDYWRRQDLRARREVVIHNGIDLAHYADRSSLEGRTVLRDSLGFAPGDLVIGLCAAFRAEKAHGDLLQVIVKLRAAGVPAKALLIGDGALRPHIEQLARTLGIGEHVCITGFQQDVRPFVAICDVMTSMSHAIETFSIAALEAMAMSKPLVMTNIGGAAEQVQDGVNGFLFAPGDIGTATDRCKRLTDPALREQMGAAGLRLVQEQFSIRRMVHAYSTHFEQLGTQTGIPRVSESARLAAR